MPMRLHVDAWFLDGFAPSKNPDMWTDALYRNMAQLSIIGTTVATFTAAGAVRHGLISAGFTYENGRGLAKAGNARRSTDIPP